MSNKELKYKSLNTYSFNDLKKMAKNMDLLSKKSKQGYIEEITKAFDDYNEYKTEKLDKYKKIKQLGNKGKEGITYLVQDRKGKEFAMKTFRKTKSSVTLKQEYYLQKKAASVGIAPRVVEYDTVHKYIVMEKMDEHLSDLISSQKGKLLMYQQQDIIDIYKKLDEVGVFHADSNILNYMLKGKRLYIIDFGFAKELSPRLLKKLGTNTPNIRLMTLGLIIKLKELNCNSNSWKQLKKYVSSEDINRFQIE